jgi:diguanylate cyclase (GGDEF)-like protein
METPRILVVDDESENLKALERTLRTKFRVVAVEDPKTALETLAKEDFAVLISDHNMPGMLGTELLAKAAALKPTTTRVLLTAYTETKILLDAINRAEIYRYLTKPWENAELLSVVAQAAERYFLLTENQRLVGELTRLNEGLERTVDERTSELKEANERLSKLAMTDPLTKVLNRRAFFARFTEEVERSRRYSRSLVVVMLDVDRFKEFNDMEGHLRGDEALKRIAATLQNSLRKTDILGRYGGEEFILLMPETSLPNAIETCERLRQGIEDLEFQGKDEPAYLTISIGVAAYPDQGNSVESLTEAADQALYQAKNEGRNRVVY